MPWWTYLPGAYLSVDTDNTDEVLMVLHDLLTELMALSAPQIYRKHVSLSSNRQPILYVKILKMLYGCLKSSLLFYFKTNPYNPCVANKTIHGSQMTVTWHVDNLQLSHALSTVLSAFILWLETIYSTLTASRGQTHTATLYGAQLHTTRTCHRLHGEIHPRLHQGIL